jgi:hypothetical protein
MPSILEQYIDHSPMHVISMKKGKHDGLSMKGKRRSDILREVMSDVGKMVELSGMYKIIR